MAVVQGLRDFLEVLETNGQLLRISEEVSLEPDIGAAGRAITQIGETSPALSFEKIKGYQNARIVLNVHGSWPNHAYDHNFKNGKTNYLSGDIIDGDYTLIKTLDKWTVGVGGYTQFQLSNDTVGGVTLADSKLEKVAAGPIVGHRFGPVIVQTNYNFRLRSKNVAQGDEFWLNVTVPLK